MVGRVRPPKNESVHIQVTMSVTKLKAKAKGLWVAVNIGNVDFQLVRAALEAICKAAPPEMQGTLATKPSAKAAWDSIRTIHAGDDRIHKAKARTPRREFDSLMFHDGETVDQFTMRITSLANQLTILGDHHDEEVVVSKFLQAVLDEFSQLAMSIETMLAIEVLSIEEVAGRIKTAEERYGRRKAFSSSTSSSSGSSGKLLLTEEWEARRKQRQVGEGSSGGSKTNLNNRHRGKSQAKKGDGARDEKVHKRNNKCDDTCHNCGKRGHWARKKLT